MQHTHEMKNAIALCWSCRTECQETLVHHCLEKGGAHIEAAHIKLMLDCIQICQTCADFMSRGSALHEAVCTACAKICEACARSCAEIDDPAMQHCAEACSRCAESCKAMGKMDQAA